MAVHQLQVDGTGALGNGLVGWISCCLGDPDQQLIMKSEIVWTGRDWTEAKWPSYPSCRMTLCI